MIIINVIIKGFSGLKWLPPVNVRSQVSDYSQLSNYNVRLQLCRLSSSPCKKEATKRQKLAPFCIPCTTLLLFYHTSDWLNQQNLPKLQVAAYLFIINWSTVFISAKSLLILNTTVILCGEHWKIGGFYCLCLRLLWLVEMFTHKENYLSE